MSTENDYTAEIHRDYLEFLMETSDRYDICISGVTKAIDDRYPSAPEDAPATRREENIIPKVSPNAYQQRNLNIINMYQETGSVAKVAHEFDLSKVRIYQILKKQ